MLNRTENRVVRSSRRSAFTLIELMLVLVILAVLAAIVVPKFTGRTEDAKKTAAKTTVNNLRGMLESYELDNGKYPTTDEGLQALLTAPASATNWKGPYLTGETKDPWGQELVYRYPGTINTTGPDIFSMGPDQKEGGDDDIGNWPAATAQK